MIVTAGVVLGAVWGALLARRRGGRSLDIAQYAAGFGILFGLVAVFLSVFLERMAL